MESRPDAIKHPAPARRWHGHRFAAILVPITRHGMRILERGPTLVEMSHRLHEAEQGRGGLLFVEGEAGVGKTVLARRFGELVKDAARFLYGTCHPLSTPRPLAPLAEIALRSPAVKWSSMLDGAADRGELFDAVLTELSGRDRPTVLVLEDVHWADESTRDLLRYLGRRVDGARSLVIATFRARTRHVRCRAALPILAVHPSLAPAARLPTTTSEEAHMIDSRTIWSRAIATAIGLVLVTGGTAFSQTGADDERSLYERLGGLPAISLVISDFVDDFIADPLIMANPAVRERKTPDAAPYVKYQVTTLVCEVTGGPCQYTGLDLRTAHEGLNVSAAEWDRMVEIFSATLNQHQVPEAEQQALFEILGPTRADIVAGGS